MKEQPINFPLTNAGFLNVISNSFKAFLDSGGTSRSTSKLKPLHGSIAEDLHQALGDEYTIMSQGYDADSEGTITGRYVDKKVDITILKEDKPVAGVAVKFVMQNYSQNSINYFENMLGETANIRCAGYPYFQIFIILDKLPYYESGGGRPISKWEVPSQHNLAKYVTLSTDNIATYFHTPNKTLVYVVHIPDDTTLTNHKEYVDLYNGLDFKVDLSTLSFAPFDPGVIMNDYETFRDKVYHTIMAL